MCDFGHNRMTGVPHTIAEQRDPDGERMTESVTACTERHFRELPTQAAGEEGSA
jgi:hypothetical protein